MRNIWVFSSDMTPLLAIGLTGGIGSGKTTVADLFGELGASIIDTDLIAHQLSAPQGQAIPLIRRQFGDQFIDSTGAMDRTKMRLHVFQNPQGRTLLEGIMHPLIRQQCELVAQKATGLYLIFVIPLLVESKAWDRRIERILVVDCKEETQIERVMARNKFSREEVIRIMDTQSTRQNRLLHADEVINSEVEMPQLRLQVETQHQKYLKIAHDH